MPSSSRLTWARVPAVAAATQALFAMTPALHALSFQDIVNESQTRQTLIDTVDLWNGGDTTSTGQAGMGTYQPTFDGLFIVDLDRQFNNNSDFSWNPDMSIISQSRAIYMNVEAYRAAVDAGQDATRFLDAVQAGADYILAKSFDQTYGGLFWGLDLDGTTPPEDYNNGSQDTHIGGTFAQDKHSYGQNHAIFALTQAYSLTGDVDHLNGALAALDDYNALLGEPTGDDPASRPRRWKGAHRRDFTSELQDRNIDYMTHGFEALLALHDFLPDGHARKADIDDQLNRVGDYITGELFQLESGQTDRGYLPWWYDSSWNPHSSKDHTGNGHNIEIAFLLSRAVERGFNPAWQDVADKLLAFGLEHGYDPSLGALVQNDVETDGSPNNGNADTKVIWWTQSELARTLMNFVVIHDRSDLLDELNAAMAFIEDHITDASFGGWFQSINISDLTLADGTDKGHVWKVNYHASMLWAEALRLSAVPEPATLALLALGVGVALCPRRRAARR